jgi:membrane peptidoglycan carboxypeptidase
VQRPVRHAGLKAVGLLAALSLGAGLLAATATLPLIGVAGVVASDASRTFNTLPVNGLGQVPARSELLDTSGKVLAYYYPRDIFRVPVRYNQIAPVMRNAIVAIEDYRYWQHGAFDLHGTLRAMTATLSGTSVQGGSDIAQQYVKNACLLTAVPNSPQQQDCKAETVTRKLRELRIAANVERVMTRTQLLTAYLNVAYFDRDAYGIDVASELYYSEKPSQLTLGQAAMLAGLVNDPEQYDPISFPQAAMFRRAEVLNAMAQHGYISQATANATAKAPLDLHPSAINQQTGCVSSRATYAAYFCDYVLAVMRHDSAYSKAYKDLLNVGGLKIYTTLNERDQNAANRAVDYVLPDNNFYNPNHDVDTEVLVQPGTGYIRAIAVNRHYGFTNGTWVSSIDYAVNSEYDGGAGVQTGSSSKLFTLVTALEQGIPFNYSIKVKSGTSLGQTGFESCHHQYINPFDVTNADPGGENGTIPLYYGTAASINAFYVALESRVGLCNVVKTAVKLGMTRADGRSLLKPVGKRGRPGYQPPADTLASFTLGSVNVSPMSMAGAYATVAARGIYCHPIPISQITEANGKTLPIESAGCHRVLSKAVADATEFALEGPLDSPEGTATNRQIGRPAAAKTGTANGGYYAAFAGFTPTLVGYVSVFNPIYPTTIKAMLGCPQSDYRELGTSYPTCPGQMYGDMAPGATWQDTFLHAALGPPLGFVYPPAYFLPGTGESPPAPPHAKHKGGGGKSPGGPGGGHH